MQHTIYIIGLAVALIYILFSVDDLFEDVFGYFIRKSPGNSEKLPIEQLDTVPPKLLAVIVAAWHEDNVLEPVIDNMLRSIQYPRSMYHIFLGVYPNDQPTIDAAARLAQKYENVHLVMNTLPGPTCKADNINNVIRHLKKFEAARNWRFASVTIHDSEDVVHPYELKFTNYLIDCHDALQFPVIPLQKMPSYKNLFMSMTSGTYADEFAENHFRTLGIRESMTAMVPSAGTGFVLSRRMLDVYGDAPLFPEDSLTEDYKLSLILAEKGYKVHYVLEKIPRLLDNNTVKWDYIATRSFFPNTFKTAVRQKTRWIYGITMQSIKFSDFFKSSSMSLMGRYSLYKDLKAKISNMMVLPGYLVFIYFVISLFAPIPVMYPLHTFSGFLCLVLTGLMLFRQTVRAVAITNFYGFKSMLVSCLFPPLMPIRLVWGNIINLSATICAWKLYFLGAKKKRKKSKVAWNKTDHEFLSQHILYRYYRNIGDVLLEKQYLSVSTLSKTLRQSRTDGSRIGEALLSRKFVDEEQLMTAVAAVRHEVFVSNISAFSGSTANDFDPASLRRLLIYPLFKVKDHYVFARTDFSLTDEITAQLGIDTQRISFVYATSAQIYNAIDKKADDASAMYKSIAGLLNNGAITWEQAVFALDKQDLAPDILTYMGLSAA